jgi:hypothetical protein
MLEIEKIAESLKGIEEECGVQTEHDELNFGLVQVVYDWARGKVSS